MRCPGNTDSSEAFSSHVRIRRNNTDEAHTSHACLTIKRWAFCSQSMEILLDLEDWSAFVEGYIAFADERAYLYRQVRVKRDVCGKNLADEGHGVIDI